MNANEQVIFSKTRTTRPLTKRIVVQGEHGTGFRTEPDGREEIYYQTTVDLASMDLLAHKAASNKSQRSSDGPITVRILERRRI